MHPVILKLYERQQSPWDTSCILKKIWNIFCHPESNSWHPQLQRDTWPTELNFLIGSTGSSISGFSPSWRFIIKSDHRGSNRPVSQPRRGPRSFSISAIKKNLSSRWDCHSGKWSGMIPSILGYANPNFLDIPKIWKIDYTGPGPQKNFHFFCYKKKLIISIEL